MPLALSKRVHDLPLEASSLVGREPEIAEAGRLLAATRLLTLTGAGGAGKTRLALEVAGELRPAFRDGVWLVELESVSDPALVPRAVASCLGDVEEPGRPLAAQLAERLRSSCLLLVLDNCEHLVQACAELAERLLGACQQVRILATSREPLRVAGEQVLPVAPLAFPDRERRPPIVRLEEYGAIRLFRERASAVRPGFALTEQNAPAVAEVCRRLDGLPLAIELAAAWVKVLAPEQIAVRLGEPLRLLTAGSRTAPARQQTLRGAIDWSHALLSWREQVLLRRLAVFAGGWDLEAAQSVCAGGPLRADDVLGLLRQLVDKSMVVAEDRGGAMRFRLLDPIRHYALEQLAASDEELATRERHCAWSLGPVEAVEPKRRLALVPGYPADVASDCGQRAEAAQLHGAARRFWGAIGGGRPRGPQPDQAICLTARELEVVALVARGLRNSQIAGELVISERTVEKHVANILGKLGLAGRAQLAAWAVQHGVIGESAD